MLHGLKKILSLLLCHRGKYQDRPQATYPFCFFKNVVFLSQLQYMLLKILQYRMCILYNQGPDLFIVDWLSSQIHIENKDEKTASMRVNINAINTSTEIPACMSIQDIQEAMKNYACIQQLKEYIIRGIVVKQKFSHTGISGMM